VYVSEIKYITSVLRIEENWKYAIQGGYQQIVTAPTSLANNFYVVYYIPGIINVENNYIILISVIENM
jgi:hypothetical protein